jgi:hypothetical protein
VIGLRGDCPVKSFRTKTLSVYPVTVITSGLRVPLWVLLNKERERTFPFLLYSKNISTPVLITSI